MTVHLILIGHQHPRPDCNAISRTVGFEQIAIKRIIIGGQKRLRAVIATLRDMVWYAGNDKAGEAGHGAQANEQNRRLQFSAQSP